MKSEIPDEINKIFGTLNKRADYDKCSAALALKDINPFPCKWQKVGTLEYCSLHMGIRIKK